MTATAKRFSLWGVVLLGVGAGLVVAFAPRPVPVDLVTVDPEPMRVTVEEEGQTRIHDVYVLSAPVAGRLQRVDAHVGDPVVAGETIMAQIEPGDPSLLDPRTEAEGRAAVEAAESAHTLALAQLDEATAESEFAQSTLRRAYRVLGSGAISREAFDAAVRDYRTRTAAVETARAAVQMRLFELERARARLLSPLDTQKPPDESECVPITAPVSGRVLRILSASERVVPAGEAILEIGNPTELEITADFLSTSAVRISPGLPVIIDGWGGDRPLPGRVRVVEPFGVTKVSALGIEEQRVNVIIDFDDPPDAWGRLGHGYQVEARVVLWESDGALTVPLTSVFRDDEDWVVFRADGGRAHLTPVQLGQRNGLVAEVVTGLSAGDRVVAHPSDRIRDGVRIVGRGSD